MPFEKGNNANPKGRPIKTNMAMLEARQHTEKAIKRLVDIIEKEGEASETAIKAANSLLDRAWGKPKEAVEITGEDGGPIETRSVSPTTEWIAGLLTRGSKAPSETLSEN